MNLLFDKAQTGTYKSSSQIARVVTESWLAENMYCPVCGANLLHQYTPNKPVADFFCKLCLSDFELKSYKSDRMELKKKIPDGAYNSMIERITSLHNPHLFVMTYANMKVNNLILIPNFFFVPEVIEQRPPLKDTARRAGWIGCNIEIGNIPNVGKIVLVRGGEERSKSEVVEEYQDLLSLRTSSIKKRGWLFDIIQCIERIKVKDFSLEDIYAFSDELKKKHPENNFVKDKIRQQLQVLRDKGFIEFMSRGKYRKLLI